MVFEVFLRLEHDEAFVETFGLSAGEVRLLKVLLKVAVVVVEGVAVFLVADVALHVLELQVRRKHVIVKETRVT